MCRIRGVGQGGPGGEPTREEPTVRSVGDELYTDATSDRDIIEPMGARLYDAAFVPAITEARAKGKSDETIRDPIRGGWTPASAARW